MSAGVHASAVLVGERGILIRGASGAGKSLLALALVSRVRREGGFAALVADDRVWLELAGDRIIARGAPELAGICERRCEGLVEAPYEARAVLRLVVDLAERGAPPPRIPQAADKYATLHNLRLPRLRVDLSPGLDEGVSAVLSALGRIEGATWRKIVLDETVFA
jgi:serine kinase of HPr protein (carbohydrate metabolism regulator)